MRVESPDRPETPATPGDRASPLPPERRLEEAGGVRASLRAIPPTVWLITALFALLLVAYSFLFPVYRGPDEPQHVDLVLAVRRDLRYPAYNERFTSRRIMESAQLVRFDERSFHLTVEEALPRSDRPSFADLGEDAPSERPNQLPQHPPLFYVVMAGASAAVESIVPGSEAWSFDLVVATMRLLNVLLIAPLPLLAFAVVRRLGASRQAAIAAALVPLAIPQLVHIGSVVNNDNLLTLLVAILTLLLVGVSQGDLSARAALGVGAVGGLALLTKGFALFVPLWVGVAYLLGARRTRLRARAGRRLALALGVSLVVGGWWWVRNLVAFGTVQPEISLLPAAPADFETEPWWWTWRFARRIAVRFWGSFGWLEVPISTWAVVIASGVVLVAIAWSLLRGFPRRASVGLLLLPIVSIGGLVVYAAYRSYAQTAVTPGIQGRYLFPGVAGLGAVVALGLSRLLAGRSRFAPVALLGGAAAMHAIAVPAILTAYWGPDAPASVIERLRALMAWSPWPPAVIGGIVLVLTALVVHAILSVSARGAAHRVHGGGSERRPGNQ